MEDKIIVLVLKRIDVYHDHSGREGRQRSANMNLEDTNTKIAFEICRFQTKGATEIRKELSLIHIYRTTYVIGKTY